MKEPTLLLLLIIIGSTSSVLRRPWGQTLIQLFRFGQLGLSGVSHSGVRKVSLFAQCIAPRLGSAAQVSVPPILTVAVSGVGVDGESRVIH